MRAAEWTRRGPGVQQDERVVEHTLVDENAVVGTSDGRNGAELELRYAATSSISLASATSPVFRASRAFSRSSLSTAWRTARTYPPGVVRISVFTTW